MPELLVVSESTTPNSDNRYWINACRPLLQYLKKKRNWDELTVWFKERNINGYVFRHTLAWLNLTNLAMFDFETRTWKAGSDDGKSVKERDIQAAPLQDSEDDY